MHGKVDNSLARDDSQAADLGDARQYPRIIEARRVVSPFGKVAAKNQTIAQNLGRRYEQALWRAIVNADLSVEHGPWFRYVDENKTSNICSPDFIITLPKLGIRVVVEAKLTYTPLALEKLRGLYCPVVRLGIDGPPFIVYPLVIAKNFSPDDPEPMFHISYALDKKVPVVSWRERSKIRW